MSTSQAGFTGDFFALLERERKALSSIVAGVPLPEVLDGLVQATQDAVPGSTAAVLLTGPSQKYLVLGSAPDLPPAMRDVVDGLDVGPRSASCGTAVHRGQAVYVRSIAEDPLWEEFRPQALAAGFRASWSTPVRGANGRILGTFANYFRDERLPTKAQLEAIEFVTHTAALAIERYETDCALRESEDHYRHAVNLNPQVAWTSTTEGELDYAGQRWQEWTGASALGRSWEDSIHPEDLERTKEAWAHALATGEPYDVEHRVCMGRAGWHWMRSRAFPRRDERGNIVKWYGATEDIEERKQAEGALHHREAELRALNSSLETQVLARTSELTELTRHLQRAQEEERSRLARDLHDELGALFTAAKFDVARLKSRLGPLAPDLAQRFSHFTEMLDKGIDLKRRIIEDLRPSALSTLGLVQALEILINDFMRAYDIKVECALEDLKLKPSTQLTIYRLVQEALTNVATYAEARRVKVVLAEEGDADVLVSVEDDGVGFDPGFKRISMHGLMGMHYRVESEGGVLYVKSSPNHGTCISAQLPRGQ